MNDAAQIAPPSFRFAPIGQDYLPGRYNNCAEAKVTFARRSITLVLLLGLLSGCSQVEPRTGTRIVLAFSGRAPTREQTARVSDYLVRRARYALGASRARVESVTDSSLVLLLPGKRVTRKEAAVLTERASLEFYHMKSVATRRHPDRPWELKERSTPGAPYIFVGSDAQRIDSNDPSDDLLRDVVGYHKERPLLTGKDLLPPASTAQSKHGYAVLVRFTPDGARRFREFSRQNPGEYVGVFYNGRLISVPTIDKPIPKGEAYITGFKTAAEAQSAANQLSSGVMPAKLTIRSVTRY